MYTSSLICSVFIIIFYANSFASSFGSERDDRVDVSPYITLPTAITLREEILEKGFKDCLVQIRHLVATHPIQHCFLSYVNEDLDMLWMRRIESYLREVGVQSTYDMRTLGVGDSIMDFIQKVREANYAIILFSPRYFVNFERGTYIRKEADLIREKWGEVKDFVIPLLLAERPNGSIPSLMNRRPKDASMAVDTIIAEFFGQQHEGLDTLYIALTKGSDHADFDESLECVFRMLKERIYKSIIGADAPFEREFDRIKRSFDDRKLRIPERALHTELKATRGTFPQSLKIYNAFYDRVNEVGQSYIDTIFEELFMEHMDERQFATLTICALSGMGGVGKTTLATEFAHKYKQFYQFVYWMDGSTKRDFMVSCISLLNVLGIKIPEEKEENEEFYFSNILKLVNTYLPKHKKNWLIIVDNIEESEFVTEFTPAGGHVLYTSRNRDWLKRLEIDVFKPEESVAYLLQMTGFDASHRDEAMALAIELDHLPLALAQAVAYVMRQQKPGQCYTFNDYLVQYRERYAYLLAQNQIQPSLNKRTAIVMTTWNTTVQKLSTNAQQLMHCCSHLASTTIPKQFFMDMFSIDDIVEELFIYSMIKNNREDNSFFVHRLVQAVVRDLLSEKQKLKAMDFLLDQFCKQMLFDNDKLETWPLSYALSSHLEQMLTFKQANNTSDSQKISSLLTIYGRVLSNQGFYNKSKEKFNFAYDQAILGYGVDSSQAANIVHKLGTTFGNLGKYGEAKNYLERALTIQERIYGREHHEVAKTFANLGIAMGRLGQYREEKAYLDRAFIIYEKIYGIDHQDTARVLQALGMMHEALGEFKTAQSYYRQVLAIFEKIYGQEHPTVAGTLFVLGNVSGRLWQHEEAKNYLKRALVIQEKIQGVEHPAVAEVLNTLSNVLQDLGQHMDAKNYLERALKIQEKIYGMEHPAVAETLKNLGRTCRELKQYQEEKDHLERALVIFEETYGARHPTVAETLYALGIRFEYLCQYVNAKNYFKHALSIFEERYGEEHPAVAGALQALGKVTESLGQFRKSKNYYEQVLFIYEKTYGVEHPAVAETLHSLGNVLGNLEQHEKVILYLDRALPIFEKMYSIEHPAVAVTLQSLGNSSARLFQYEKAKNYFERALVIYEALYEMDNPAVIRVLQSLRNVLEDLGRPDEAKVYLNRMLEVTDIIE